MPRLQQLALGRAFCFALALAVALANLLLAQPAAFIITLAGIGLIAALASPTAMLLVLLTLAPLRTLIATESALDLPLDIGQILFALYLGTWLAHCIAARKAVFDPQRNTVLSALLCLCAVFALGAWTSASQSAWLREWLKWVLMAVFVWQIPQMQRRNCAWLIFALLVAASANALVGLYIFFGGSGADHLLILGRYFRAFGSFGQPNPFAGFMGLIFPLALMGLYVQAATISSHYRKKAEIPPDDQAANAAAPMLGLRPRSLRKTLGLLCCFGCAAALLGSALLASWSRGAWLGAALSVAVMLFALPRRALTGFAAALALALFLAGLWLGGLLPQSIVTRLTASAADLLRMQDIRGVDISPINYAVVERVAHWQAALNMAQSQPIFGLGLGNYEIVYDQYRLLNWRQPLGHAHNFYLNTLAETGLLGLSAYLGFWIVIFLLTWRARAHPDLWARASAIALLGSWTYLAVHSIFDNLFVNNLFLHIGVLLSMLAILQRQLTYKLVLD